MTGMIPRLSLRFLSERLAKNIVLPKPKKFVTMPKPKKSHKNLLDFSLHKSFTSQNLQIFLAIFTPNMSFYINGSLFLRPLPIKRPPQNSKN